jgi:hypothetical protein
MAGATVELEFASAAAERRFVRTHLPDAWERFEASHHWDHGWFWRYGQVADYDAGPEGGLVRLVFDGDPDAFVAAERDGWDAFDGLTEWTCRRYDDPEVVEETYESLLAQQRDAKGAVGGEREYRFKALTARLAVECYRTFDEDLPAAPDRGGEGDPIGIGVWALLHDLLVQLGYDWYDETDAAMRMLRNRLRSIAAYRGADAAREEYDRLRREWCDHEGELEAWLEEHPTGRRSEP